VPLAVCATPIGNLEDVTLRVLAELRVADVVLCEDTRRTRTLLERHGLSAPLRSYHRHNEVARTQQVLAQLAAGARVALVSDAGLPGINDPGARLVDAALDGGLPVTVLPGPSAVETALVASGFVGAQYRFVGYLPRRAAALDALWVELGAWPHPVVAFESPQRLSAALRSLASALPDRPVAVCRELTKAFETVVRGTALEVAERLAVPVKGEITVVIGSASPVAGDAGEAAAAVSALVAGGAPRGLAAEVVARLTGRARNELYRASL
jgi:16S rRNA (cytidine1402-2'-O)-methyltransferase